MAEYLNNDVQTVALNGPVILNTAIANNRGFIYHRPESGIFTLRGCNCNRFARYLVEFNANIAVPDAGTAGEISVAVSVAGEPIPTSTACATPTETGAYFNAASVAIIDVPNGCCMDVSIENNSTSEQAINVRNANLIITRIA